MTNSQTMAHDSARTLLRIEGLVILAAAVAGYFGLGGEWGWLAALFLAPDLALFGYLAGPAVGGALYNAAHSYVGPAILASLGLVFGSTLMLGALIWVAHIGFDRALGYGLKQGGFRSTHLGRIGHDHPKLTSAEAR